ncbi:MAG: GNAT family N-acetyltransferase [Lachnospiraceae bacterium]|jgi:RimJ/RimL family protein N-acetyltransferase|nr:GNAT family N-acetyltransferase [Lachnospiraceae bacterium]MBR3580839.1 GNAT family N-acetyltransferase [Lachnospiraceae bacterium]
MRVTIETERLILRPVVPDDYEAAFKWCGDPNVNKYMIYPLYTKAEDVRTYLESRNLDDPDNYDLGFTLKETGELIGQGGLVYVPEKDAWTIGYNIRADQWGHGYAVEAMEGIIKEIRKTRPVKAIIGEFAEENNKSRRVMEKLGMHCVGDHEYEKMDKSAKFKSKLYRRDFGPEGRG